MIDWNIDWVTEARKTHSLRSTRKIFWQWRHSVFTFPTNEKKVTFYLLNNKFFSLLPSRIISKKKIHFERVSQKCLISQNISLYSYLFKLYNFYGSDETAFTNHSDAIMQVSKLYNSDFTYKKLTRVNMYIHYIRKQVLCKYEW